MDWWLQQFYLYCERGTDPGFWAEPFNAVSNGAFLIAAALAWVATRRQGPHTGRAFATLAMLAGVIGIASFCFHTTAARWALVFDTGSIAVFTFVYLGFAIRRFLAGSVAATGMTLLALAASFPLVRLLPCPGAGLLPITAAAGHPCLNGSLGYVPVIVAMVAVGALLLARGSPVAKYVLGAAAVFCVSLILRSLDTELCAVSAIWGQLRGTHALWHVLNSIAIYLLLIAAGRRPARTDR